MGKCLDFYRGGRDHRGRTIDTYLNFSDWEWEHSHDVIQTAFPLPERSAHFDKAPLLQPDEIEAIKGDIRLVCVAMDLTRRFLKFLGLEFRTTDFGDLLGVAVIGDDTWHTKKRVWIQPRSHNYKRITRLLRFLHLIGLQQEADEILACMKRIRAADPRGRQIDGVSVDYWEKAVRGEVPKP